MSLEIGKEQDSLSFLPKVKFSGLLDDKSNTTTPSKFSDNKTTTSSKNEFCSSASPKNLNDSPCQIKEEYVNFDDIQNFDIFQDSDSSTDSRIKNLKFSPATKKVFSKSEKKIWFVGEEKNSKKLSLEKFEKTLGNTMNFVDAKQNKSGNYHKYVESVFKSIKDFKLIDFEAEVEKIAVLLEKSEKSEITLILDLDETLVHSDFTGEINGNCETLSFIHEGEEVVFDLYLRPGLFEFLDFCKKNFELIVFTASRCEYADCVLDYLDPDKKIFSHRLYRDSCITINNKIFLKDLRIFNNRDIEKTIIVDNSLYSFVNQLSNGILITSFYSDEKDFELLNLIQYLEKLKEQEKINLANEKVFGFMKIKNEIEQYEVRNFLEIN